VAETKVRFPQVFTVGFAAETNDLEHHARHKLVQKGLEMVAANWVGKAAEQSGGTFGSDSNALQLIWAEGQVELPLASKAKLARSLIAHIAQYYTDCLGKGFPRTNNVVNLNKPGKPVA